MYEKKINFIKNILHKKGYKLTSSRKTVVMFFLRNLNKHFEPLDIYEKLKSQGNSVSLSTIYRTVRILKECDIIEELIYEDKKLYELKLFGQKSVHVHFNCLNCDKIKNYIDSNISLDIISKIEEIENKYDFKVENIDILFSGYCKACNVK
ncbi:Fur family transcriptional regulator [Thermohalobacter berrensis]|uniref:Transcriptional repressor n=1 Tax=Thermohalobacter berrensis TaxID=99594 RepID=A0A419T9V2_9FIRM|nr:Fur family transcriptional regulator [Thermohalobacter berrensis]RKD34264.1 hypothetical protein BET03_00070 [Thermohalobacter berrensis]